MKDRGLNSSGLFSRFAVLLLCSSLVAGRSWHEPRPSKDLYVNVLLSKSSAAVVYIKAFLESDNIVEFDPSDVSFTLDFGTDVGTPEVKDCKHLRCVNWTSRDGSTVAELIVKRADDVYARATSDNPQKLQVVVNGPAHRFIFHHTGEQLFGGPVDDIYPSNADTKINAPSTTHEGGRRGLQFANAVVERIWYTSSGRGIRVSEDTPLFFSQNDTTLILTAKNALPYPTDKLSVRSEIDLCLKDDVKQAWLCFNEGHKKPSPPDVAVRKPTLSTWVYYEREISQEIILDFANQMRDNNLDVGILGIDDGWETCYGSQIVNTTKFPDMKQLIDQLHEMNMTVTFWVHPFVNVECEAHERLSDYLVRYDDGTVIDSVWWNGKGAMINFLNDSTTEFYVNRLRKLQEDYGVDGFKFDAGETSYIYNLNEKFKIDVPNMFTKKYVEMAAKFGPIGEVRVGAGTFDQPIRQRLQDTNSSWLLEEHGLKAVIPAMLQLTILGYGATIPDMVGGNAYGQDIDKELLIRWAQLTTFMPNMQFSYPPWKFDDEALKVIRDCITVHYKYSTYMMDLFFSNEPTPVVAPLWWIDPTHPEALTRDDEYLVGDQILVAPVVEQGAVERDIYFPSGVWLDVESGITYEGPQTVRKFSAPLEKLPWFVRQPY